MEYYGLWSENTRMPLKLAKYKSMATVMMCDVTVTATFPVALLHQISLVSSHQHQQCLTMFPPGMQAWPQDLGTVVCWAFLT